MGAVRAEAESWAPCGLLRTLGSGGCPGRDMGDSLESGGAGWAGSSFEAEILPWLLKSRSFEVQEIVTTLR